MDITKFIGAYSPVIQSKDRDELAVGHGCARAWHAGSRNHCSPGILHDNAKPTGKRSEIGRVIASDASIGKPGAE